MRSQRFSPASLSSARYPGRALRLPTLETVRTAPAALLLLSLLCGLPVSAGTEPPYVVAATIYEGDSVLAGPTLSLDVGQAAEVTSTVKSGEPFRYRVLIHSRTDADLDLDIRLSIGDASYNPRLMVRIDKDVYVQVGEFSINVAVTLLE